MSTPLPRTLISATLALAATGLTLIATAGPVSAASIAPSINVRTGDLNLASPAGQATLHNRLRQAARSLCDVNGPAPVAQRQAAARCARETLAGLAPQVQARIEAATKTQLVSATSSPAA
ncbi:UrcA family protein [Sandaracinobacteroides saxicola]|uniref:UrcA family protein n=1 Tax=Sandaracinobacteroides saxicola TaxID=2759707 RepID=A0A7G5IEC4_9SPHN|nr:UrcA family protein [Sandaracinobacteroides saxicola]QMW21716.1 UrcA family protein [Sandaracinobacteroides saxicola]